MNFFICQRVYKTEKCLGKIREKSGNFEMNDKWQPCLHVYHYKNLSAIGSSGKSLLTTAVG